MVLSNEPGYYQEDCYGIRCENLMIVKQRADGMLEFETISFAPFDTRLVDTAALSAAELAWLNRYHGQVAAKLTPLLSEPDAAWLMTSTAAIG